MLETNKVTMVTGSKGAGMDLFSTRLTFEMIRYYRKPMYEPKPFGAYVIFDEVELLKDMDTLAHEAD